MSADELRLRLRVSPRYHERLLQHLEAVEPRARGFELLRLAVDPSPDSTASGTVGRDWVEAGSSIGSTF